MTNFPIRDTELHKIFKGSKLYVLCDDVAMGLYQVKIHPSKVKDKACLKNAFNKVSEIVQQMGFSVEFIRDTYTKAYCREHNSSYHIYFKII